MSIIARIRIAGTDLAPVHPLLSLCKLMPTILLTVVGLSTPTVTSTPSENGPGECSGQIARLHGSLSIRLHNIWKRPNPELGCQVLVLRPAVGDSCASCHSRCTRKQRGLNASSIKAATGCVQKALSASGRSVLQVCSSLSAKQRNLESRSPTYSLSSSPASRKVRTRYPACLQRRSLAC